MSYFKIKHQQTVQDTSKSKVIRTGAKRYMAPEILNKTIDTKSLHQYQNAEMYSLALIIWETLQRTKFEYLGSVYSYEYKMPYHEYMPMESDDSIPEFARIVCDQNRYK